MQQKKSQKNKPNQNNDELTPIQKGYNWTALVGQVIKGNLIRGAGGKFANKSELSKIQDKIKQRIMAILKKAMERKLKAERKKTEAERRRTERAAAKKSKAAARKKDKADAKKTKDKEKQKNREKIFQTLADTGKISLEELNALFTLRQGGSIDPKLAKSLAQKGLVEINEEGIAVLGSRLGARSLLNAADRGDIGDALRYLEASKEKLNKIKEKITDKEADIAEIYDKIEEVKEDLRLDQEQLTNMTDKMNAMDDPIKIEAQRIAIERLKLRMERKQEDNKNRAMDASKAMEEVARLQDRHGLSRSKDTRNTIPPINPTIKSANINHIDKSLYDSRSVQIMIDGLLRATAIRMAELIDTDYLDAKGRELNPHITVKYGFPQNIQLEDVQRIAQLFQPFKVRFGQISLFENDDFDVVKVEVESEDLRRLNNLLSFLPNSDERTEFNPHLTIAYVLSGLGWLFCNMRNELVEMEYEVREVMFSDEDGKLTRVPLGGNENRGLEKSRDNAPGYRLSDETGVKCSNCLFAVKSRCELYDFEFDEGFVCQSWISEVEIIKA